MDRDHPSRVGKTLQAHRLTRPRGSPPCRPSLTPPGMPGPRPANLLFPARPIISRKTDFSPPARAHPRPNGGSRPDWAEGGGGPQHQGSACRTPISLGEGLDKESNAPGAGGTPRGWKGETPVLSWWPRGVPNAGGGRRPAPPCCVPVPWPGTRSRPPP